MVCPFCKINEKKTKIIKNSNSAFVCLSNPRLMPGHLLVIPKRHIEKISQLNNKEKQEIFDLLAEFQEKILKNIADGCDIRQNFRPFLRQNKVKIDHIHFHLQPRFFKDELYKNRQAGEKPLFKKLSIKEIRKITQLFKNNLENKVK